MGENDCANAEIDALLGAGSAAALFAAFQAELPARLARLQAAAAASEAAVLRREAHALAGSAGLLGLHALARLARALEEGALLPRPPLAERFAPIERELAALLVSPAAVPPCTGGDDPLPVTLVSRPVAD